MLCLNAKIRIEAFIVVDYYNDDSMNNGYYIILLPRVSTGKSLIPP